MQALRWHSRGAPARAAQAAARPACTFPHSGTATGVVIMKPYVIVSGALFAAVFVVHMARGISEGWPLVLNPVWDGSTAVVLAMSVWAVVVLRRAQRPLNA